MPKNRSPKVNSAGAKKPVRKADARSSDDERFLVVGIGASAGGLDACNKLLDALPADSGMVFILVQHLDPSHESMMVDLLSRHTAMPVRQAADGLPLERGHVYVIPPGADISVEGGVLRLSQPQARHGARLPFDFLLRSLAQTFGSRAASVVLSGTGADGSLGSKMIKENGGLVIAQSPDEAGHDGMPRSAMATGAVDLALPVSEIPGALAKFERRMMLARTNENPTPEKQAPDWLGDVIKLLRAATAHDFTQYKPGTLQRRIERRMALALIESDDMDRYLEKLRSDPQELELLAKDLLINVTSFFRDPDTFDYLARDVVPELVASHDPDRPLRIWIAGCSTGEECYSLAMLFQEQISATGRNVRLQVFASDVDADAVAQAREGVYPESIETVVSPDRLKRFFIKEGCQYRVTPELRAAVIFTVQDLLADPPFSRLDFVSCRNLLIYLRPEAQAKVISVLKFALREGGVLFLGGSESIGAVETGFETLSKSERVYRRVGHSRPGDFPQSIAAGGREPLRAAQNPPLARQSAFAELCQRLIVDNYAPAAVLINRKHECLYSLGATDRFMRVAPGAATHDLIASARDFARVSLRSVIQKAWQENARVVVKGRQPSGEDAVGPFRLEATPAVFDGEELMLVCFIEEPERARPREPGAEPEPGDAKRIEELEEELDETRNELETAIRSFEVAAEEQQAINQEALSVNEEYLSTNEELETSKEELQSLNEELTALNNQLQESLELQRTASDDLQNVLYSTDVATVFLDPELRIRIFTPAAKDIFHIIPSDIGRPLADLSPLIADSALLADARQVIRVPEPIEKEIKAEAGAWYSRRITPYRTQRGEIEGVVVTFTDITDKHRFTDSLSAAKEEAQRATAAKSRFLAAASHDLRQPLQTLVFLQGLLEKTVEGEKAQNLVMRLGDTVNAMSGMLNALLDINQIEANAIRVELARFPINDLLVRVRDEFAYQAQSQGLELRMTPSKLFVESDPSLLEQMIRNLLSNALKYTTHGKVLLGCRRRNGKLRIEVWDTGAGIPEDQFQEIFEEYRQLGNGGRDRSRGLGLGLSIVRRLGGLLGHKVDVRSQVGKGSVFSIEVKISSSESAPLRAPEQRAPVRASVEPARRDDVILVIEDNREVRELLELALREEGFCVASAADGEAALELASSGGIEPDVILADFNLPKGMNGVITVEKLRKRLGRDIPAVILTGDISIETLRDLDLQNWVRLNKPVNIKELTQTIRRLAPPATLRQAPAPQKDRDRASGAPIVFVVDDDRNIREELRDMLEKQGWRVKAYGASEAFLDEFQPGGACCLLIDSVLPGMSGTALLERLRNSGAHLPAIMITGYGDVRTAVNAMKKGAIDFIEKPVAADQLIAAVERALDASRHSDAEDMRRGIVEKRLASLTPRQREVLDLVLAGQPSKNIAADLGISQRTVENHRAAIMDRTGATSIPELVRLVVAGA